MNTVDATTLNTLLLVLVIPAIGGLWRTLVAINKTLASLHAAITGVEGQGGALSEIARLRTRVHHLESVTTSLLVQSGITAIKNQGDE